MSQKEAMFQLGSHIMFALDEFQGQDFDTSCVNMALL